MRLPPEIPGPAVRQEAATDAQRRQPPPLVRCTAYQSFPNSARTESTLVGPAPAPLAAADSAAEIRLLPAKFPQSVGERTLQPHSFAPSATPAKRSQSQWQV